VPKGCRVISFSLLSESATAELRRYQQFITDPMACDPVVTFAKLSHPALS
jgi:hypothetical protein